MKPILLFALISIILIYGCENNKPDDNILPEINPYLGVWEYKTGTITKRYEFTDSVLIFTRETESGDVSVKKGEYTIEEDGSIIWHNITEVIENDIPKPHLAEECYYLTRFFNSDTLRIMDYFFKSTRLSGDPNELNNSSFHRYFVRINGTDTSYTHTKGVFENDSAKSFIAFTDSPALPEIWSPQGGSPVSIYPEYYITSVPSMSVEIGYYLAGEEVYIGPWMPESKYVKILIE